MSAQSSAGPLQMGRQELSQPEMKAQGKVETETDFHSGILLLGGPANP